MGPGPPVGYRGSAVLGFQGVKALEKEGFEVLMLAEIGSPESKANNPEYLFSNENHQSVFFIFHRCHILVHIIGPYFFVYNNNVYYFTVRFFY